MTPKLLLMMTQDPLKHNFVILLACVVYLVLITLSFVLQVQLPQISFQLNEISTINLIIFTFTNPTQSKYSTHLILPPVTRYTHTPWQYVLGVNSQHWRVIFAPSKLLFHCTSWVLEFQIPAAMECCCQIH